MRMKRSKVISGKAVFIDLLAEMSLWRYYLSLVNDLSDPTSSLNEKSWSFPSYSLAVDSFVFPYFSLTWVQAFLAVSYSSMRGSSSSLRPFLNISRPLA
jgi:hypothetical protein